MNSCAILGCNSSSDPADQPGGVRFFEFPHNDDLRQKWCTAIEAHQGPLPLNELNGAVCERHFEPAAFLPDGGDLTPDAVPTLLGGVESRNSSDKNLLEILTGCVIKLQSGGVCCGLKEDEVSCSFTQERFESRTLLQHICDEHPHFAAFVELIDENTAKAKIKAKHVKQRLRKSIVGWQTKVLSHVSKEADGYHCRIEGPACRYTQPSLTSVLFARHFRRVHPVQAFDYGYYSGFRRQDIRLKEAAKFRILKSKVDFDGSLYRCNISTCNFWVKSFDAEVMCQHICEKHVAVANHYALFNKTSENGSRSRKRRRTESKPSGSKRKALSAEIIQIVKENVEWDAVGSVRCRISGTGCSYKQRTKFDPANFYCHFCVNHPNEFRAKGLSSMVHNALESSGSDASSTATESEDDASELNFLDEENSSEILLPIEENEDDESMLTTPSDDPSFYCRLCFSIARPLQSIFAGPEDGAELIELISSCTNIRLSASSDAPSSICLECHQKLDDIQRFRELAQTLDAVVRQQARLRKDLDVESCEEFTENQTNPAESSEKMGENPPDASVEMIIDVDDDAQPSTINRELTQVTVNDKSYYKCPACGFLAKLTKHVVSHWTYVHEGGIDMSKKITCTQTGCAEIFFNRVNFRHHLSLVHNLNQTKARSKPKEEMYAQLAKNQFACRNCGQVFGSTKLAMDHFQSNHRKQRASSSSSGSAVDQICEIVTVNGGQQYRCRDCTVMTTRKLEIAIHWLQQHKENGTE